MKLDPGFLLMLTLYLREATAAISSEPHRNLATEHRNSKVLVPKVSLTQKGYIQVCTVKKNKRSNQHQ